MLLPPDGRRYSDNWKELLRPVKTNQGTVQPSPLTEESITPPQTHLGCTRALTLTCSVYSAPFIFYLEPWQPDS